MAVVTHNSETLIVGLGPTGLSVARYLGRKGVAFAVTDSRENPPGLTELRQEFPDVPCHFGNFDTSLMESSKCLVVSPGVAVATPQIAAAQARGAEVIGDVELFVREARAPIVAITGSNGKSSVTKLVEQMAHSADMSCYAIGNIGRFVLDALTDPVPDLYVMELSSFQLETTRSLKAASATVLNVCEDHMDRYDSFTEYAETKAVIYQNCKHAVFNQDDQCVMAMAGGLAVEVGSVFSMTPPVSGNDYGVISENGQRYLAKGTRQLLNVNEMRLPGDHNISNALAALALGDSAGIPEMGMVTAIREFAGLPHRTEWIREHAGVHWFNDSKGTNVGATLAALQGLPGKTVLIAGGQGKDADFSPLKPVIREHARAVVLMGEDALLIAEVVNGSTPSCHVNSMNEAVQAAAAFAKPGDNVLLSPACASFDMFENYLRRGEVFSEAVRGLSE